MTWKSRFKLVLGVIAVIVIVAAFTLVFNQRQTQVTSTSAAIAAQHYDVGTDYGGIVSEAFVEVGDEVFEGQRLFEVQSLTLERDVEAGAVSDDDATVTEDGTFVVKSAVTGVVSEIAVNTGSYASPGAVVATIDKADSLFASADFILTSRDFGRIEDGATVELVLPDQRSVAGSVEDIAVETVDGEAHVTARVASDGLVMGEANNLIKPGTPLTATLHLRDDGPLAGVDDAMQDFLTKIGL
ncbi:HlyD family efflux transporter periplasmic adaptor subunit [Demequina globuliformis]|uniref:HlyD family efflux transporter periplasmic adaptor subunit n=1 Tax=Demequina globuliformis TaxID=676202 RepID=UPI000782A1BB|nr:HlyD family efflux transporter periplasmic adaptor subunit [Demequina globuliformis]